MKKLLLLLFFIPSLNYAAFTSNENQRLLVEKQIQKTEISISNLSLKMENTKKIIFEEKEKINQLTQEETALKVKLQKEKEALNQQLLLAYRIKETPLLQTLLTQKAVSEDEKIRVYLTHLNQAQLTLAQQMMKTINLLEKTNQTLLTHQSSLEKIYQNQKMEKEGLELALQKRKGLLCNLHSTETSTKRA